MREITVHNLRFSGATIDGMKFDEVQVEVLFKFLMSLGATKDTKMYHLEDGGVTIMKPFKYPSSCLNADGVWVECEAEGQQYYTLGKFLRVLIRFDRAAHRRMKNVEKKVNQMHAGISALTKQMKVSGD